MRNQDRFRGCLIGGAAGDALGYAVEFRQEGYIFSHYGEQGITEYELTDGKALISDDTQMTLFTATGLLVGTTRGKMRGIMGEYFGYIYASYTDWLKTQEKHFPLQDRSPASWLVNVPELFDSRAPGTTCMAALRSGKCGDIEEPINHSKGCGGVMRVAPIGLYFNDREMDVQKIARIGADAAAITHGHPLGWLPAAMLVQIIHEVSQNDESILVAVQHALETLEEMWPEYGHRKRIAELIQKAIDLATEDMDDLDAIHELGEGWVGEEALAIAQLLFQANITTLKMGHFGEALFSSSDHQRQKVLAGIQQQNRLRCSFGIQLLNKDDQMDNHTYSFSGISDVYDNFMLDMAGAAEIPATKLFGRSPQGLNANGVSDLKNYAEMISGLQERMLRPALEKLLPVMAYSCWGFCPDDMDIVFTPIIAPTPEERADLVDKLSSGVIAAFQAGLITRSEAVEELKARGAEFSVWNKLTQNNDTNLVSEVILPEQSS